MHIPCDKAEKVTTDGVTVGLKEMVGITKIVGLFVGDKVMIG